MPISHSIDGLKGIRQHKRVPIQPLADVLGITYNSYCRIESGKRRIFLDHAVVLAKALAVSVDDLTIWRSDEELVALLGPSSAQLAPVIMPEVPPPPGAGSDIVVNAPPADAGDSAAAAEELRDWNDA
jgi:transcriptional regulator with XRE-family HTH domain